MSKLSAELSSVTVAGLDLAKHVFQIHCVDGEGRVVVNRALRRREVLSFFGRLPPSLVGIEACGSAHHWGRELTALGHDVKLMPPAYVKPYVRRQKNDAADAEAICEAVTRPSMRFVEIRSIENQAVLMRHRTRELLVGQRTQLLNALRGHLAEAGVIAAQGAGNARITVTVYLTPKLVDSVSAMARLPRLVIPGLPHHVTQRGNGRQQTFFEEADYALYLDLLAQSAERAGAEVWAYCLMPNHVHAIIVPADEDGLRRTFGDLHRRYTGYINARARRTGHAWQGRFGSVAMDEAHLASAIRYVSLNPVRARLVKRAADWRWSSAKAHLAGADDHVVKVAPVLERVGDFAAFLAEDVDEAASFAPLRRAESIGRPIGSPDWIEALERRTRRSLAPGKRGPVRKDSLGVK